MADKITPADPLLMSPDNPPPTMIPVQDAPAPKGDAAFMPGLDDDAATDKDSSTLETRRLLRQELKDGKTLTVFFPVDFNNPDQPPITGQINGFTYQIPRGGSTVVPESIYMNLLTSGKVNPQREGDEKYLPVATQKPLNANRPGDQSR